MFNSLGAEQKAFVWEIPLVLMGWGRERSRRGLTKTPLATPLWGSYSLLTCLVFMVWVLQAHYL